MYIINVPQGRGAVCFKGNPSTAGLYTSEYSTCFILAAFSADQTLAGLLHIDLQTSPEDICQMLNAFPTLSQLIIITRPTLQRQVRLDDLKPALKSLCPQISIKDVSMDEAHDGVLISFSSVPEGAKNFEVANLYKLPVINRFSVSPPHLIRHPEEQRFTAVQKIEQVMNVRKFHKALRGTNKSLCIFNGLIWMPVSKAEMTIDPKDLRTRAEWNMIRSGPTLDEIENRVHEFLDQCIRENVSAVTTGEFMQHNTPKGRESIAEIAFYIEGLCNNFEIDRLYLDNLKDSLNYWNLIKKNLDLRNEEPTRQGKLHLVITHEDTLWSFIEIVEKMMNVQTVGVNALQSYIAEHVRDLESPGIKHFNADHDKLLKHYKDRMIYVAQEEFITAQRKRINEIISQAVSSATRANHEEAIGYLRQIEWQVFIFLDVKSVDYATYFWNFADILQKLEDPSRESEMKMYFAVVFSLVTQYKHLELKKALQNALNEMTLEDKNSIVRISASDPHAWFIERLGTARETKFEESDFPPEAAACKGVEVVVVEEEDTTDYRIAAGAPAPASTGSLSSTCQLDDLPMVDLGTASSLFGTPASSAQRPKGEDASKSSEDMTVVDIHPVKATLASSSRPEDFQHGMG